MAGANETYTIDIKAALAEGDSVSGKLDALSKSLLGANQSADQFEAATVAISDALAAAKAAVADTSTALEKGNAQWAELETNAIRAAKAVERAASKGAVPDELVAQATEAKAALEAYAVTLSGLEKASADAQSSTKALGLMLDKTGDAAKAARAPLEEAKERAGEFGNLRSSLAAMPGPLGKIASGVLAPAQGFQKLAGGMGVAKAAALAMAAAAAAVAVAVVALTVAVVVGVVKVAAWAVGLADAARSAGLATEAFAAMNPELAGLDFAGVANETGLAAAQIQGLAKQLKKAGVVAEDMPAALRAAAIAQKALGSEGASDFIESLKDAKQSVGELANATTSKLGGIVARQMMGLDAQSERFSRNIDGLFGGLNIDPVLEGMAKLVALFDENTAAGEALQFLFETIFQPLIDVASEAATAIEAFYLGVMIGAMELYISLKPTIKAVKEFFGLDSSELEINFESITELGRQLAPVFAIMAAIVGGVLAAAFVSIGVLVAAQIAVWYTLAKAVQAVIFVWDIVIDTIGAIVSYIAGTDTFKLGADLMSGFVGGVMSYARRAVAAVTGVIGDAIRAAKGLLGIRSPSRVFASIGEDTGAGFAGGVEDTTDAAHDAVATMVTPNAAMDQAAMSGDVAAVQRMQAVDAATAPMSGGAPAAAAASADGAGAAGARTITLLNPVIQLGPGSPKEQATEFVTWLTDLLEGDAAQAAGA